VGEDGHEDYCRWCGEGGDGLLLCETCQYVFCETCVKGNLGEDGLKAIHDDDGICLRDALFPA
jgi:transcriptional regulator ATRX